MEMTDSEVAIAEQIAQQVVELVRRRQRRITATYRIQFHRNFTFHDAAAILPYLKDLGISHVYCSPYLRSRTGSQHGYDICDHSQFNPELGGEEGYRHFVAALQENGLGQILDIVPNHMAASLENPWWVDVLENGPVSPYSQYFDIDWSPIKQELAGKVLLPILGQQYGEVLEEGQLRLDYHDGAFSIHYYEHALPLGPKTTIPLLANRLEELRLSLGEQNPAVLELESIITAMEHLPPQTARETAAIRERQREKEVIKRRLRDLVTANPAIGEHIARNVAEYSGDPARPESFDRLDLLLDDQPYRLSHWRSASDEINYRRFFDINGLAAICMELPEVFHAAHALLWPALVDGTLEGFRIDHVDGLYDPEQYLWRLQWAYLAELAKASFRELQVTTPAIAIEPQEQEGTAPRDEWRQIGPQVVRQMAMELGMRLPETEDLRAVLGLEPGWEPQRHFSENALPRSSHGPKSPLFVIVEKILGPDEPLPETWPVAGTSGYDFLNALSGLFIAPQGYNEIVAKYERFLEHASRLPEIEYDSKLLILRVSMASELQMLAHRLNRISEQHRRSRDITLNSLRQAIRAVLACFPVYRIYPGKHGISDRDRKVVNLAVVRARRRNPAFDPQVLEFLRSVLLLTHPPGLSPEQIAEREVFTGKFQQVTSPVMAKGVEDTAFYVHVPLVSANEVGSDPVRCATTIGEFHRANCQRNLHQPRAMLATSTHDTKRSEDARARLHVLTEIPQTWRTAVGSFSRANEQHTRQLEGEQAPSRNDEYLFYQSLLAIWPLTPPDSRQIAVIVQRMVQYMEKATREAKQRTSWINPDVEYDTTVRDFVTQALSDSPRNKFLRKFVELHRQVAPAGLLNALGQVTLKLLSPGIPDIYQGQELWDFSLVDPDNRRPVDYAMRRSLLAELLSWDDLSPGEQTKRAVSLGRSDTDPRLKLLVTHRLLALRRHRHELFSCGRYVPIESEGTRAEHLVALGWREDSNRALDVIAIVPRRLQSLLSDRPDGHVGSRWKEHAWADTTITLPAEMDHGNYRCLFTGRSYSIDQSSFAVSDLLDSFPVAVLCRDWQPVAEGG